MIKIHKDRIVMRRLINQHNIECYCEGKRSEYCKQALTYCSDAAYLKSVGTRIFICDRCFHRDDMNKYPERVFIGFTRQIPGSY